jgi:alcohol dehydrogenase
MENFEQYNPRFSFVQQGIDLCKKEKCDYVLTAGGVSVLDAAKGIAAGAEYNGDAWDFYTGKAVIKSALPIGVILRASL